MQNKQQFFCTLSSDCDETNSSSQVVLHEEEGSKNMSIMDRRLRRCKQLSQQEVKEHLERYKNGDEESKEILINSCWRTCKSVVRKNRCSTISDKDLFQECMMNVMKVLDTYDINKGVKFYTYVFSVVQTEVRRYINNNKRNVRISTGSTEQIIKMRKVQEYLFQELERDPTPEEISDKLDGISVERVTDLLMMSEGEVSLEYEIDEDSTPLYTIIEDKNSPNPENYEVPLEVPVLVSELIELPCINDRERDVLKYYYGLYDGKTWSYKEIGEKFQISIERVRQIKNKGIEKLQKMVKTDPYYSEIVLNF